MAKTMRLDAKRPKTKADKLRAFNTPKPFDMRFTFHGSFYLARPLTPDGDEWIEQNIVGEVTWHGDALVVEPRFAEDVVAGMIRDGIKIQ